MNKLICIGNYYTDNYFKSNDEYRIYYDPKLDKFYSLPLDFLSKFKNENKGLEILEDLMPDDYEEPEFIPYEITNKDEIKALKAFLVKREEESAKEEKRLEEERKKEARRVRISKNIFKGALIIAIIAALKGLYSKYEDEIHDYSNGIINNLNTDEEERLEYLSEITDAITLNDTIDKNIKDAWIKDFTCLFNRDIYFPKSKVNAILAIINEMDFNEVNEDNHISSLASIIFNDNTHPFYGLTLQLDEFANDRTPNNSSVDFGLFYINLTDDVFNQIFIFGNDRINYCLAKSLNTDESSIEYVFDNFDFTYDSGDSMYDYFHSYLCESIGDIYIDEYKNRDDLGEFERLLLASNLFNKESNITVKSNMFSDTITVTINDSKYGEYNLYFDAQTKANISASIYQEKLTNLIKEKGSNLDYKDPDSRFLSYLFYLSYLDKPSYDEREGLVNPESVEEFTSYIISTVFKNRLYEHDDYIHLNPEFLYSYFTNGNIVLSDFVGQDRSVANKELAITLFTEYERALRYELRLGNITDEEYDKQFKQATRWIANSYAELYAYLKVAIDYDIGVVDNFTIPLESDYSIENELKELMKTY